MNLWAGPARETPLWIFSGLHNQKVNPKAGKLLAIYARRAYMCHLSAWYLCCPQASKKQKYSFRQTLTTEAESWFCDKFTTGGLELILWVRHWIISIRSPHKYIAVQMCVCVCETDHLAWPRAAAAHHICCSGIRSLSASWSETTSTPAVIYHREVGWGACARVCLSAKWVSQRWGLSEKTGTARRKRKPGCGGTEASHCRRPVNFHEQQSQSSPACSTQQHHPSAPIHSPPHTGPVREAKSPAANLIILCRCVSCSRNGNRVCLCGGDGD